MYFDLVMIILSAFAVFGVYCLLETLSRLILSRRAPLSVTVMIYSEDCDMSAKIKNIQNEISNNKILLISDENSENIHPDTMLISRKSLEEEIKKVLFTKTEA